MHTTIAALSKTMSEARRVVILSGAGLSADSGIPIFRDEASGLWANVDPDEVVSVRGFENNPDKVWAWHEAMRGLFTRMSPNAGHREIAALEWLLPRTRVSVITQNIDGLHQVAGSTRVFELHGNGLRIRCHHRCGFIAEWPTSQSVNHHCPSCGAPARPDVVWFGELLDKDQFAFAVKDMLEADIFITVGTSSSVHPAASLPLAAKDNGALLIEINPHPTPISGKADILIRMGASAFFKALSDALGHGESSLGWDAGIRWQNLVDQIDKRALSWLDQNGVCKRASSSQALRRLFKKSGSNLGRAVE